MRNANAKCECEMRKKWEKMEKSDPYKTDGFLRHFTPKTCNFTGFSKITKIVKNVRIVKISE